MARAAWPRRGGPTPTLPLDPELFVASQPVGEHADPWEDLADGRALARYRLRVRRLVSGLRRELREERAWARARLKRGDALEAVLGARSERLSPLGRYLIAAEAGRPDLADRFREGARAQHRTCPLYRLACRDLLPAADYPVFELLPGFDLGVPAPAPAPSGRPAFGRN